jgi:hypothetical protein
MYGFGCCNIASNAGWEVRLGLSRRLMAVGRCGLIAVVLSNISSVITSSIKEKGGQRIVFTIVILVFQLLLGIYQFCAMCPKFLFFVFFV